MNNELNSAYSGSHIIPAHLAIRAMRDSGYRNTAYALSEIIDNAVQAGADLVKVICLEETVAVNQRNRRRIKEIGVFDNGSGMPPDILRMALQFGNGTHLQDRSGIGRFGMGLPNSSISQGRRVDVWTWQNGPANAMHCYLDVDEIETGHLREVPEPTHQEVPEEWQARSCSLSTTGTLVVWSKFDEERLTWKGARATLDNTETLVGRMYRKFISQGILRLRLVAIEENNPVEENSPVIERDARVNDPLYLMAPSSTPAPFDNSPMFQRWGEDDHVVEVEFKGIKYPVTIRASWAKPETLPEDGKDRGSKPYGKHAAKNIGLSIVRAGRELDLDPAWSISYEPTERWWGLEIEFPPDLDEVFGVTNNKQAATTFSHMAGFDWRDMAEPGESLTDFKRRMEEEGDPRAGLIDIVTYIQTQLPLIRTNLGNQTKGRRSGRNRHEPTVEDRASTKFKERVESGHEMPSDREEFDENAERGLVKDLVNTKKYPETAAKEIAADVRQRGRKVILVEMSSEMDAFFSVEQQPGITQVAINRSHPAYDLLVKALDDDTSQASDRTLVERIQNASEALKMLLAAWARQEIEDIPNREKLRRMRMDWGRMARDFLLDE